MAAATFSNLPGLDARVQGSRERFCLIYFSKMFPPCMIHPMINRPQPKKLARHLLKAWLLVALLALAIGACSNIKPQGHRVRSTAPATAAGPALTLPSPAKPTPLPAERVLNILFTSNGDGDVDPCG